MAASVMGSQGEMERRRKEMELRVGVEDTEGIGRWREKEVC